MVLLGLGVFLVSETGMCSARVTGKDSLHAAPFNVLVSWMER